MTFLDTHVAIWLYSGDRVLSEAARKSVSEGDLWISPVVLLEMQFLHEIARIGDPDLVLPELSRTIGLRLSDLDLASVVDAARGLSWTRDPFDRLIVGHASTSDAGLVTRDKLILRHYERAIW